MENIMKLIGQICLIISLFISQSIMAYPCKKEKKLLKKFKHFKVTEYEYGVGYPSGMTTLKPLDNKKNYFRFYYSELEAFDLHLISGAWANYKYEDDEFEPYPIFSCVGVMHDEGHEGQDYEETYYIKALSKTSFATYYFKEDLNNKTYLLYQAL